MNNLKVIKARIEAEHKAKTLALELHEQFSDDPQALIVGITTALNVLLAEVQAMKPPAAAPAEPAAVVTEDSKAAEPDPASKAASEPYTHPDTPQAKAVKHEPKKNGKKSAAKGKQRK